MDGYAIVPSFGIMVKDPDSGKVVFCPGDTQYAPNQLTDFYRQSDFIVQDCETMYRSGVHAHYDELKTLPDDIKAKMLLVHYQDNVIDNWKEWNDKARSDGFTCREFPFVAKGTSFEIA